MRALTKFSKSITAALLLWAALPTGCSRPEGSSTSPSSAQPGKASFKFVVISHATAVPFFVPVRKGVEEAGRLLGVDASFTGPADFNVARQIEFIKAAIAAGADGIATTMPDPEAFYKLSDHAEWTDIKSILGIKSPEKRKQLCERIVDGDGGRSRAARGVVIGTHGPADSFHSPK